MLSTLLRLRLIIHSVLWSFMMSQSWLGEIVDGLAEAVKPMMPQNRPETPEQIRWHESQKAARKSRELLLLRVMLAHFSHLVFCFICFWWGTRRSVQALYRLFKISIEH